MKNAILRDTRRTVERSMSRFFSIIAIVALGISFFAGMSAITPDMRDTVGQYYKSSNIMDIQIMSTVGLTDSDLETVKSVQGMETVVPQSFVDGMLKINGAAASDLDGSQLSVRALGLDINAAMGFSATGAADPGYLNRVTLLSGSYPTKADECLVDASTLSTPEDFKLGSVVSIEGDGTDLSDKLLNTQFTVVGIIRSPLYVSYERGNSTVGTGKLSTFIYIPSDNFTLDYYPMLWCKVAGSEIYDPYGSEYEGFIAPYLTVVKEIVEGSVKTRSQSLLEKYTSQVAEGENEYNQAKAEAELQLEQAKKQLAELKDFAQNGDGKIAELKAQYNDLATQANTTIDSSRLKLSTEYSQWEKKRDQYNKAKELVDRYANAETEYNTALNAYNSADLQVNSLLATVSYLEKLIATTRSAVDTLNENQDTTVSSIIDRFTESGLVGQEVDGIIASIKSLTAMGTAEEITAYLEPELQTLETQLSSSREKLKSAKETLAENKVKLDETQKLVEKLKEVRSALTVAETELAEAEKALESANNEIKFSELETLSKLQDMKFQIDNAETELKLAKEKVKTADADYEAGVNQVNAELEAARVKLDYAQKQLSELDVAVGYTWGRDEALCGYEEYGQTIERTKALAAIFPVVFFLVAALVCLNTMTRMVEEERTQQGTLKALGYGNREIASKYIIYAFSASAIGSGTGSLLGFAVFPTAVCKAYSILYDLPAVEISFRWGYAILGTLIAVGSTVAAAAIASFSGLRTTTAALMRPKSPKSGKRVLLERVNFIWNRLSFTSKVTFRNVARSKKRFLMAVIGVMGCTALMVAGFGLSDSVGAMLKRQFLDEDRVCRYDLQIALKSPESITRKDSEALATVTGKTELSSAMLSHVKVYDAASEKTDKTLEAYLVVPQVSELLPSFVSLKSRTEGTSYTLDDTGVIITEKLSDTLGLAPGDTLTLKRDIGDVQVRVSAVVENYTFHYVYMSKTVYASLFGEDAQCSFIMANFKPEVNEQQRQALAASLMDDYRFSAVSFMQDMQTMFSHIVSSLNYIVTVLIVSAGLLALIVLYNLSSININERLREIATLKVLGFDDGDVSAYIFRENLILSILGTFLGLFLGIGLHKAVIMVAQVDIAMFGKTISPMSFLYSALLSLAFSLLVNLILFRRLKRVDMVESLKSVE